MKLHCDIIQDLIPSYVDGLCSETSKKCVEEHLQDCESCRQFADLCKNNSLSGDTLEQKQLDGLKKVKQHLKKQHLFYYLLLLFISFFGLYTFGTGAILSLPVYYILTGLCLMGICLLGTPGKLLEKPGKTDFVLGGVSLVCSICSILLLYISLQLALESTLPFGLPTHHLGPILSGILSIVFLLQLAFTIILLLRLFRKDTDNRFAHCLTLAGAFLALILRTLLGHMTTLEGFRRELLEITLIFLAMGILGATICLVRTKRAVK